MRNELSSNIEVAAPLEAANANSYIVNNVTDAQNTIKQGKYDAGNATDLVILHFAN